MLVSPFVFVLLGFWYLLNGLFFAYLLSGPEVRADLNQLPQMLFGSGLLVWLLLPAFAPLLTLRLFAEEHRLGTLEPLLTAPISDAAVVLAKYLAACLFFMVFWGGLLLLFGILAWHGGLLDWARVMTGFVGAILVSLLFLATGLWASAWSGNLVLAAGGGAALNFALLFVPVLLESADGRIGSVAHNMNIPDMLDRGFSVGLLDSYALAYFPSLAALFLFLAWVRLVSRRWVP
jgi:gliding motility-associated transport system permease protein